MRLLIQNGYILSLDTQDRIFTRGDIFIDGSKIVQIGCDLDVSKINPDRVINASNKLVTPGLVNADLHAAEVLSKGLFENRPLEMSLQDRANSGRFGPLTKELVYETALLAGIHALKTGTTTVQDHWRFSSIFAKEGTTAVMNAYRLLGIRANLALEIEPDPFSRNPLSIKESLPAAIFPGDAKVPTTNGVRQVIDTYKEALEFSRLWDKDQQKLVISTPEQFMMSAQFVEWLADIAECENIAIHFHFNQTKGQVVNARKAFQGKTAIERADELGLLTPHVSIADAVWVTPSEIELLALKGVTIIHTPISDLYAGSGMIPLHKLIEAGVPIGLGSGETCGGNQTLFDVLKMTAEIHRIVQPDYNRWVSVEQALLMATHGGARACLLEKEVGQIAIGFNADLVLYDLKSFSFSPLNNPKDQLVCLESGSSVDTVLVDGKIVVEGGRVIKVDESDVIKQFRTQFQSKNETVNHGDGQKEQLESHLNEVYWKYVSEPMQIRQWADNPAFDSRLKHAFKKKGS
jgi:5-methylthioadenosine/S-adenosylhomocysteine deaminase